MQKCSFQVLDEYKLWYKPDPTINRHDQSALKDFLYHVVLCTTYSKSLKHIYWLYIPHCNDIDSKFVKQHTHVNHPSWFLITGYRSLSSNGKHDKTTCISLGQIWLNVTATSLKIVLFSTKMDWSIQLVEKSSPKFHRICNQPSVYVCIVRGELNQRREAADLAVRRPISPV